MWDGVSNLWVYDNTLHSFEVSTTTGHCFLTSRAGDFDAQCNSVVVLTSFFAAKSTCSKDLCFFGHCSSLAGLKPFSSWPESLSDSIRLLEVPGGHRCHHGRPSSSWRPESHRRLYDRICLRRHHGRLPTYTAKNVLHCMFSEPTHVYGTSLHREMSGLHFTLWIDDSTPQSFEVCTETVDDCALLSSSKQHPSMQATSIPQCNTVVVLVFHVDASENVPLHGALRRFV